MRFDAFISGSYELDSVVADCQRTINLFPEAIESGSGRTRARLRKCPGLDLFATMPDGPVRKLLEINSRVFAIAGGTLVEIFSDGTTISRGPVASTGVASMAASPTQLIISAGNKLYCYTLATNVLTPIATPAAEWVGYCDTFFVCIEPGSQKLYSSDILDGTSWDPADVATAEAAADNVRQVITDHREVWFFGERTIRPYSAAETGGFPFLPIPGGLIETGIAGHTAAKADNTIMWVNQDALGNGIVYRAQGYTPVRISHQSVERDLQGKDLSTAEAWTYQEGGHTFYCLPVPGGDRTWVFDVGTGMWHERSYWDVIAGEYQAHRACCHCFAWGKHLVGDRDGRQVYEQSLSLCDDDGDAIRWMRRSPHLANENKTVFYDSLELVMDTGTPAVGASDPQVAMRMSNDGGRNWGSETWATSFGKIGETFRRVMFRRLGRGRDRVFEVSGTDSVPVTIVDALLEITPGTA